MRLSFVQKLKNQKFETVDVQSEQNHNQNPFRIKSQSLQNNKKQLNQHCSEIKQLLSILEQIKNPQFKPGLTKFQQISKIQPRQQIKEVVKPNTGKKQNKNKSYPNVLSENLKQREKKASIHVQNRQQNFDMDLQRKSLLKIKRQTTPYSSGISENYIKMDYFIFPQKRISPQPQQNSNLDDSDSNSIQCLQIPKLNHSPKKIKIDQTQQQKRGLQNIGNTCYINSVIQCLFHLSTFNNYFVDELYFSDHQLQLTKQKFNSDRSIVQKYKELYNYVIRGEVRQDQKQKMSTFSLKLALSKSCSLFLDWEQEDAHEFMRKLLDSIHQELNRQQTPTPYKLLKTKTSLHYSSLSSLADQYFSYYKQKDDSYIYDSFRGQIYNNIQCISCSNQSVSFENCLDISLPIIKGKTELNQLLGQFFGEEKLTDYYKCQYCGQMSKNSTKTTKFWRTPDILILHLKRSQFGRKNQDPLSFPVDLLSLKDFINNESNKFLQKDEKMSHKYSNYTLKGIVCHRGVLESGHYWAIIKQFGQWYEIDDQKVNKLEINNVKQAFESQGSSSAYILFYESLNR